MRAQYEFAFSHVLHIRPWEIDLLTVEQFDNACSQIDEYIKKTRSPGGGEE